MVIFLDNIDDFWDQKLSGNFDNQVYTHKKTLLLALLLFSSQM